MKSQHAVVIGAGAGGLACAIDLARRGVAVTVLEKASVAGGKIHQTLVNGTRIDSGPTVFTMRWIFESLFEDAGTALEDHLRLCRADILARHAWTGGGQLDLYADFEQSVDAIAAFAGTTEAQAYRAFAARCQAIYETLRDPFMQDQRPSQRDVIRRIGLFNLPGFLRQIEPATSLWSALGRYFRDPRLRQLFARYATYVGSSPFSTPMTIMLIAHVEKEGVWSVDGGMQAVATALQALAEGAGVHFRFNTEVTSILTGKDRVTGIEMSDGQQIDADAVFFNGDISALGRGLLGTQAISAGKITPRAERSLSAITFSLHSEPEGFPLSFHNVFFADDYRREFDAIFREQAITGTPTVYLCAQDRAGGQTVTGPERLFLLVNAPADGDGSPYSSAKIDRVRRDASSVLEKCGLSINLVDAPDQIATPVDFDNRFPGSGGALYGQTCHGMMATLSRAGAKTRVDGLYMVGGSVHPGPGVPMAAMSGRLAAAQFFADQSAR